MELPIGQERGALSNASADEVVVAVVVDDIGDADDEAVATVAVPIESAPGAAPFDGNIDHPRRLRPSMGRKRSLQELFCDFWDRFHLNMDPGSRDCHLMLG